jgi:hypothetical protein
MEEQREKIKHPQQQSEKDETESQQDQPAEEEPSKSPLVDAYLAELREISKGNKESLTWDQLTKIVELHFLDDLSLLTKRKGGDPADLPRNFNPDDLRKYIRNHPEIENFSSEDWDDLKFMVTQERVQAVYPLLKRLEEDETINREDFDAAGKLLNLIDELGFKWYIPSHLIDDESYIPNHYGNNPDAIANYEIFQKYL